MKKNQDGELKKLGDRLKKIRLENGYRNQISFAREMGKNNKTISFYETGQRTPDTPYLRKICAKFDIDPSWLLTGKGKMKSGSRQLSIFNINTSFNQ